jgi:hypothetical protein
MLTSERLKYVYKNGQNIYFQLGLYTFVVLTPWGCHIGAKTLYEFGYVTCGSRSIFFCVIHSEIKTLRFLSSYSRCAVSVPPMYFLHVQGVLFIVSLGTVALSRRKYAFYGTFRSRCGAQGNDETSRLHLKCDGTRAENRFHLPVKRTSPFKSAEWGGGSQFSRLLGSRGVRIRGCNAGYTMFRGSVKSTGYPLHSPVSPLLSLPCVTVCHHISTGLYLTRL